jgi:S-formylglutathione hydrolase FrmB
MTLHLRSDALELNTTVNLLIPQDVKVGEKFKVLYLLHGYIGDHTDWTRYTSIERYAWEYRYAIVMPAVNNSYYMDTASGLKYFTYITKELPQFITTMFPVSDKKEDTFIAGLSMGGYGALKAALTYPERYQKAASLSGALNIDHIADLAVEDPKNVWFRSVFGNKPTQNTSNDLKYLIRLHKRHNVQLPNLYLVCGTEDFLYQDHVQFHQFLVDEKIDHIYLDAPGVHDWAFWDEHIQKILAWL